MLTRLEIEGFRTFREMTVENLARVNLFVGKNNAGKTSVLEALEILIEGGNPLVLWQSGKRRRELVPQPGNASNGAAKKVDARQLFCGRTLQEGQRFYVRGMETRRSGDRAWSKERWTGCSVCSTPSSHELITTFSQAWLTEHGVGPLALAIADDRRPRKEIAVLDAAGGFYLIPQPSRPEHTLGTYYFVETGKPDPPSLGTLWGDVLLGPEEPRIVEALRIVEPAIERLGFVPGTGGGFFVYEKGGAGRVPLGSMGEGVTHMLSLALHLVHAGGGYLLVDDIDTGLHHSVMKAMWRMIVETARRLDVQIFATTHSQDCVEWLGLAWADAPDVLVHRIRREPPLLTTFTADDTAEAAARHMEIR